MNENGTLVNKFFGFLFLLVSNTLVLPANAEALHGQQHILNIAIENTGLYTVSMWVPFGSTSDSVPGIAHVMEHLKFKHSNGKGFAAFDVVPGSNSNAATTYQYTRYDLNVPPGGLAEGLRNLAKMIVPLSITEKDLKIEKLVVTQELLQRTQSDPDTQFYLDFNSELFKGMAFEKYPGGSVADVAKVSMQDVLSFDAAHYQNSSFFLQISGPYLTPANRQAIRSTFPNAIYGGFLVNREFRVKHEDKDLEDLSSFLPASAVVAVEPSTFEKQKTSDRARTTKMTWSKIISAPTSWRAVAASSVLADAMRSRLAEGLRDKIADDAGLVQSWNISVGRVSEGIWQMQFTASLQSGVEPQKVKAILENYLSSLATSGISQMSFERLKKRNFLLSEWENVDGRVRSLGQDIVDFGFKNATSYLHEIELLELDDVNNLMVALQKPGRVGVALISPAGATQ